MLEVRNMTSETSGREVANQFIIEDTDNNVTMFQSYDSPIIKVEHDAMRITVYPAWDYSMTTGKYRNKFLRDMWLTGLSNKNSLAKAMKEGEYCGWTIVTAA